ncbi:MAG TPA: hypothetical protein VEP66_06350 [Myxococcales bacterium]|nr:hypothetical protein [Myxococcales bacterium]
MARILAFALAGLALPALAQSTTTTTTQQQQPQQQPPPPPPSSTTTVTTQQQPQPAPAPSTQVVVNPQDPGYVPPPTTTVVRNGDEAGVSTAPSGRSTAAIIATDALFGGIAGALVGGGIALIDNGNNWERKLMIGGGVGILVGAGYGVYEAVTYTPPRRSVADADPGTSNVHRFALNAASGHF